MSAFIFDDMIRSFRALIMLVLHKSLESLPFITDHSSQLFFAGGDFLSCFCSAGFKSGDILGQFKVSTLQLLVVWFLQCVLGVCHVEKFLFCRASGIPESSFHSIFSYTNMLSTNIFIYTCHLSYPFCTHAAPYHNNPTSMFHCRNPAHVQTCWTRSDPN